MHPPACPQTLLPGGSRNRPRVSGLLGPHEGEWASLWERYSPLFPRNCGYNFPGVGPTGNNLTIGPKHELSLRGLYRDTGSQEVLEPDPTGRSWNL